MGRHQAQAGLHAGTVCSYPETYGGFTCAITQTHYTNTLARMRARSRHRDARTV
jgi:hypothetical protein